MKKQPSAQLGDRASFLYVEHARIEQDLAAVAIVTKDGRVPAPAAALTALVLGPGTTVSHAAVSALAACGCGIAWAGEEGVRLYAAASGAGSTELLYAQARLWCSQASRLATGKEMVGRRFRPVPDVENAEQLQSFEGRRMAEAYRSMASENGLEWPGRVTDAPWSVLDPLNKALSSANACLYGICHCVVATLGLSPGLGFVHSGHAHSFVFDVADMYKLEVAAPVAFREAKADEAGIGERVRRAMRDEFRRSRLLERVATDLAALFGGGR